MKQPKHPVAILFTSFATLIALLVLLRYAIGTEIFVIGGEGFGNVNPMTAIGILFIAIASFIFCGNNFTANKKIIVRIIAAIVILIGAAKLFSIITSVELGIDKMIFINRLGDDILMNVRSGIALYASINFIFIGVALLLFSNHQPKYSRLGIWLIFFVFIGCLFTVIGYLFNSRKFALLFSYTPMALFTAIGFEFLSVGILAFNSDIGFMKSLMSKYSGGRLARILLPASIAFPILIGFIALHVHRYSGASLELMLSFFVTTIIVVFIILIWYLGLSINHLDIKNEAEKKIETDQLESAIEKEHLIRLREEKFFKTIIDHATDVTGLTDADGKIIYLSPSYEPTTGFKISDTIGKLAFEIMHPEQAKESISKLSDVLENPGKIFHRTNRFLCKDGSSIWCEGTVINLLHDKDIQAIVSTYKNINDKKIAEEKLIQNEKTFRALIENGTDIIGLIDEKGKLKYLSASFERHTGYSTQQFIGKEIFEILHPKNDTESRAVFKKIVEEPNVVFQRINQFKCKDGTYIWGEGTIINLLHDENVNAIVFNFRNTNDKKIAEEKWELSETKFKLIVDSSFDGLSLSCADRIPIYYNKAVQQIIGWSMDEILKMNASFDLIHPDDAQHVGRIIKQSEQNPLQNFHAVYRVKCKAGDYIWLEATFNSMLHVPSVNANVTHIRDITAKKIAEERILHINEELEEKVQQRTGELEEKNKELEMFSSIVSHDLRTPLAAISGFANLLNSFHLAELSDDGKEFILQILQATDRMNGLISDLLFFSKLGKTSLHKLNVSSDLLVKKVIANYEKSYHHQAQIIVNSLPHVEADESLLEQVWLNFISNAIKYSAKKDTPKIEISCITNDVEFVFSIKDNGAGFSMEKYNQLFKPFQRMHSSAEFEGNGIGLAIVKNIIEKHGGKLWAESKIYEGSCFYFSIPRV
ncbi:MAG: hypothetical protein RIQ33_258 [Bacteroidota bacterium]